MCVCVHAEVTLGCVCVHAEVTLGCVCVHAEVTLRCVCVWVLRSLTLASGVISVMVRFSL